MIVASVVLAQLHNKRMERDPVYHASFMEDVLKRFEGFNSEIVKGPNGPRPRNHPVILTAIKSVKGDDLDHAFYLIRNDMDKFDSAEKEWLRENGFLPRPTW